MTNDSRQYWLEDPVTRRQVLRGALGGAVALGAGGVLLGCGGDDGGDGGGGGTPATGTSTGGAEKLRMGGTLRVGATGGGASDTIDAHKPTVDTDIMRAWNMYESLAVRTPDFSELQMLLAESIEAAKSPKSWDIRLKPDLTFHNGKPVTADDVIFSLQRITDPEGPEGRRGVDRLHRPQAGSRRWTTARCGSRCSSPTRASRTTSASTSTRSSRRTTTRRTRSARGRSSSAPSPPASRARSRSSPTTGRAASPTSTSS